MVGNPEDRSRIEAQIQNVTSIDIDIEDLFNVEYDKHQT